MDNGNEPAMTRIEPTPAELAEYAAAGAATTPEGPSPAELVELCNLHGDRMWSEGRYTTARALYLAAQHIEETMT